MKILFACLLTVFLFACQNPEDQATTITDTNATYNEGNVLNSPPGATSADTSGTDPMVAPDITVDTANNPH